MMNESMQGRYQEAMGLFRAKQYPEALAILDELYRYNPGNPDVLYLRALCLICSGQISDAKILISDLATFFNDERADHLRAIIDSGMYPQATPATAGADNGKKSKHYSDDSDDDDDEDATPLSSWAMYSLVTGIVSLGFAGVTAPIALYCGIRGLRQIKASEGELVGRGHAISGIVIACISIILGISILVVTILQNQTSAVDVEAFARKHPELWEASYDSYPTANEAGVCMENLGLIGIMANRYAKDHNNTWPTSLSQLYPNYISTLTVFICPTAGGTPGAPAEIDTWSSYQLIPMLKPPEAESLPKVICCEKQDNHLILKNGQRALYCTRVFSDGHVDLLPKNR